MDHELFRFDAAVQARLVGSVHVVGELEANGVRVASIINGRDIYLAAEQNLQWIGDTRFRGELHAAVAQLVFRQRVDEATRRDWSAVLPPEFTYGQPAAPEPANGENIWVFSPELWEEGFATARAKGSLELAWSETASLLFAHADDARTAAKTSPALRTKLRLVAQVYSQLGGPIAEDARRFLEETAPAAEDATSKEP